MFNNHSSNSVECLCAGMKPGSRKPGRIAMKGTASIGKSCSTIIVTTVSCLCSGMKPGSRKTGRIAMKGTALIVKSCVTMKVTQVSNVYVQK